MTKRTFKIKNNLYIEVFHSFTTILTINRSKITSFLVWINEVLFLLNLRTVWVVRTRYQDKFTFLFVALKNKTNIYTVLLRINAPSFKRPLRINASLPEGAFFRKYENPYNNWRRHYWSSSPIYFNREDNIDMNVEDDILDLD